jgi:LPXTG-site transpeptidase (sortase) family protein
MRRGFFGRILVLGTALLLCGAAMRVYAQVTNNQRRDILLAARPQSPGELWQNAQPLTLPPADGDPKMVRLPDLGLWNALEPVELDWASLEWATSDAGWHRFGPEQGRPGQGGNVVITGHSPASEPDLWARSVFRQLAYLEPGDAIELQAGGAAYRYRVARAFAVPAEHASQPDAARWIAPGGPERLTLVTCWPPHTAAYRIIVVALPEILSP